VVVVPAAWWARAAAADQHFVLDPPRLSMLAAAEVLGIGMEEVLQTIHQQ